MNGSSWERWAPASGLIYAVLSVVGLILIVFEEVDTKSDAEILAHYADAGDRAVEIAGFILLAVGVQFFLLFANTVRTRFESAGSGPEALPRLAFGASVASVALLIGAGALMTGTSLTVGLMEDYVVDPNLARFALGTGYLFLLGWVLAMSVLVVATSALALRRPVLPTWLGWVGFAAVAGAFIEAWVLPLFVMPAWVALVSLVLIVREPSSRRQEGGHEAG